MVAKRKFQLTTRDYRLNLAVTLRLERKWVFENLRDGVYAFEHSRRYVHTMMVLLNACSCPYRHPVSMVSWFEKMVKFYMQNKTVLKIS